MFLYNTPIQWEKLLFKNLFSKLKFCVNFTRSNFSAHKNNLSYIVHCDLSFFSLPSPGLYLFLQLNWPIMLLLDALSLLIMARNGILFMPFFVRLTLSYNLRLSLSDMSREHLLMFTNTRDTFSLFFKRMSWVKHPKYFYLSIFYDSLTGDSLKCIRIPGQIWISTLSSERSHNFFSFLRF